MKWKKNEILVSLLCTFPSLLLIIVTLFLVPCVASQKEPIQNPTDPMIDMENRTESMLDTTESFSSEISQEDTIEGVERLEYQEKTQSVTEAAKTSQPTEFTISEEAIESNQTAMPTELTPLEKTESPAIPEGTMSKNAFEESSQSTETLKSTETIGSSQLDESTNIIETMEENQTIGVV